MGKMGGNILRSWDDGTLPPDWDPSIPTTTMTLLAAQNRLRDKS
jgi:large subunit ribosomal protein L13